VTVAIAAWSLAVFVCVDDGTRFRAREEEVLVYCVPLGFLSANDGLFRRIRPSRQKEGVPVQPRDVPLDLFDGLDDVGNQQVGRPMGHR